LLGQARHFANQRGIGVVLVVAVVNDRATTVGWKR
jgi:hypothetical protein